MKKLALITICLFSSFSAEAAERVGGYMRKDGVYVQPHYRTAPDRSYQNNYSSQGNYNPYTGRNGTVSYDQYQQQKYQNQNNGYRQPRNGRW